MEKEVQEFLAFSDSKRVNRRRSSFFGFQPEPLEASNSKEAEEAYLKKLIEEQR